MLAADEDVLDPVGRYPPEVAVGPLAAHQLAEPDDRVQGGTEFVAHRRQKVALRLVGGAQCAYRRGEVGGQPLLDLAGGAPLREDRRLGAQLAEQADIVLVEQHPVPVEQDQRTAGETGHRQRYRRHEADPRARADAAQVAVQLADGDRLAAAGQPVQRRRGAVDRLRRDGPVPGRHLRLGPVGQQDEHPVGAADPGDHAGVPAPRLLGRLGDRRVQQLAPEGQRGRGGPPAA